jgi:hypothetical protein
MLGLRGGPDPAQLRRRSSEPLLPKLKATQDVDRRYCEAYAEDGGVCGFGVGHSQAGIGAFVRAHSTQVMTHMGMSSWKPSSRSEYGIPSVNKRSHEAQRRPWGQSSDWKVGLSSLMRVSFQGLGAANASSRCGDRAPGPEGLGNLSKNDCAVRTQDSPKSPRSLSRRRAASRWVRATGRRSRVWGRSGSRPNGSTAILRRC